MNNFDKFRIDYKHALQEWLELTGSTVDDIKLNYKDKYILIDGHRVFLPKELQGVYKYIKYIYFILP